jgi:hypothetical protein
MSEFIRRDILAFRCMAVVIYLAGNARKIVILSLSLIQQKVEDQLHLRLKFFVWSVKCLLGNKIFV